MADRKSTRLNSSHTVIYTLSLHDALPISQLPAGLPVERRAVEGHLPFLARRELLHALAAGEDGLERRLGGHLLVAEELVLAHLAGQRLVRIGDARLARPGEGPAGALLLHPLLEALDVDGGPALRRDHLREIDWKPVGVVQLERELPGDLLAARELVREDGAAPVERAQEQVGLVPDGLQDPDA